MSTTVEPVRAPFDVVIGGGQVLDGTGAALIRADVGIRGDRVVAVGGLGGAETAHRIDATGRIVAPGFVDVHSHSDFSLLADPAAESALAQGVTTEIVGNCGHGCAPIGPETDERFTANIYGWAPGFRPIDWTTVAGYLEALDAAHPAINVATLVPLGNLRLLALDDIARPADSAGIARISRLLDEALDQGALGLSSGLEYPAEHAAAADEIDALCRRVASRSRLYATHTRDRGRGVVEWTAEAVHAARATGVRTQVSHILARRGSGAPEANTMIADMLDAAVAEALPLAWDVHTRRFGITNLSTAARPDILALPASGRIAALHESTAILAGPGHDTVIASFGRAGWDRTFVLEAGPRHAELACTSVAEVAANAGVTPIDILLSVLRDAVAAGDMHRPMAYATTYTEDDIAGAVATSRCAVGSDATTMSLAGPLRDVALPGAFTWAAWFLRRLIFERHVLPLPEAIRRITSLPAHQAGLADRGRLLPGARADIAVLDPAAIREPGGELRPAGLATGVDHVLVNGVVAWSLGAPTGARPGMVIRA